MSVQDAEKLRAGDERCFPNQETDVARDEHC